MTDHAFAFCRDPDPRAVRGHPFTDAGAGRQDLIRLHGRLQFSHGFHTCI